MISQLSSLSPALGRCPAHRANRVLGLAALPALLLALHAGLAGAQGDPAAAADHQLRIRCRVRILEWQLNNQLDTGFTVNYLRDVNHSSNNVAAGDTTFPSGTGGDGLTAFFDRIRLGPGNVELAIQALESTNRLKVLSEPVLTLNAKSGKNDKPIPATFFSGRDMPYETLRPSHGVILSVTEFRQTGIHLKIDEAEVYEFQGDPNQRYVRLNFNVSVSRPGQEVPIDITPQRDFVTRFRVISRELNTELLIPEHSPFIAGIIKNRTETENTSGIPFLSEIPIVGALFRSNAVKKMDTELIFLVTAEVLWPDTPDLPAREAEESEPETESAPEPGEPAPAAAEAAPAEVKESAEEKKPAAAAEPTAPPPPAAEAPPAEDKKPAAAAPEATAGPEVHPS